MLIEGLRGSLLECVVELSKGRGVGFFLEQSLLFRLERFNLFLYLELTSVLSHFRAHLFSHC